MGCLIEQRFCGHDHSVRTVAALRRLLSDEGCLYGVRLFGCAQPFDRGDCAPCHLTHGRDAGPHGLSVKQHRAGAALGESATKLRSMQTQRVAQDIEQRLDWVPGFDPDRPAIDTKLVCRHVAPQRGSYHFKTCTATASPRDWLTNASIDGGFLEVDRIRSGVCESMVSHFHREVR